MCVMCAVCTWMGVCPAALRPLDHQHRVPRDKSVTCTVWHDDLNTSACICNHVCINERMQAAGKTSGRSASVLVNWWIACDEEKTRILLQRKRSQARMSWRFSGHTTDTQNVTMYAHVHTCTFHQAHVHACVRASLETLGQLRYRKRDCHEIMRLFRLSDQVSCMLHMCLCTSCIRIKPCIFVFLLSGQVSFFPSSVFILRMHIWHTPALVQFLFFTPVTPQMSSRIEAHSFDHVIV
jgi:hypothetical protein